MEASNLEKLLWMYLFYMHLQMIDNNIMCIHSHPLILMVPLFSIIVTTVSPSDDRCMLNRALEGSGCSRFAV